MTTRRNSAERGTMRETTKGHDTRYGQDATITQREDKTTTRHRTLQKGTRQDTTQNMSTGTQDKKMLERLSQGPWHRLDTADAIRRFDGPSLQNARSRRSHQQNCRRPQSRSDRMRSRMQANWASQKARQPGIHGLAQLLYQLHSPADEHGFLHRFLPK